MIERSRRAVLRLGATVGTAGIAGCAEAFGGSDCETGRTAHDADVALPDGAAWPSLHRDAANTGHAPDVSGPVDDVEVAWRYSACTEADSGVVLRDGRAYVGGLVVDAATGRALGGTWSGHFSTPSVGDAPGAGSAAVTNTADATFFASSHDLEARDPETGAVDWTVSPERRAGAVTSATVVDGTVYVGGGIQGPTLYAVDAATGEVEWRFEAGRDVDAAPAVADGVVYVVDETDTVSALDAASGDERWQRTLDDGLALGAPTVAGGRLYLGASGGAVLALDVADGSTLWRRDVGPADFRVRDSVAVAGDLAFAAGREGAIVALDAADGGVAWARETDAYELGPPAVADGVAYVGARDGVDGSAPLLALDAASGDERWRVGTREVLFGDYTRSGIEASPAVVDGAVYVATAPGDLYAIHEA